MLWQAQHGGTAEEYRKALTDRGVRNIPAYLTPPEALPGAQDWMVAFFELATDRHFIGGPIPGSSIAAYPVHPSERDLFRRCIREADAAYLRFINQPPESRQAPPPMMPGGAFT